jgi:hypothetical protein
VDTIYHTTTGSAIDRGVSILVSYIVVVPGWVLLGTANKTHLLVATTNCTRYGHIFTAVHRS